VVIRNTISRRVGSGRVSSGRVSSGRVTSGRVTSGRVGSGRVGARLLAVLAVAAAVAAVTPAAAAGYGACARQSDEKALNARLLQTELMVGALACGNQSQYNAFVQRFRGRLVDEGKSLQQMFSREYKGAANRELNALITRLANQSSQRSMVNRIGFCEQNRLLFAEALEADAGGFDRLVEKVTAVAGHGIRPCDAPVVGYGTASRNAPSTVTSPR